MARRLLLLASLIPLLNACNMLVSEKPMFSDSDKAAFRPREGIWVGEDPDCHFDSARPEPEWPSCATWLVATASGEVLLKDGKDQSQPARFMIVKGDPPLMQILWRDEAKDDGKTFYVFYGLEPGPSQTDGTFVTAAVWEVQCGIKDPESSETTPYPGVTKECVPTSQDAVRSAAKASRATAEEVLRWHWLRPEVR